MRVLAFAALLAGCADDVPSRAEIERLRVLAIRAEAPEIRPGTATAISTLVAGPFPFGDPVSMGWRACAAPPGDDPLRCLDRPDVFGLPPGPESVLDLRRVPPVAPGTTIGLVALACVGAIDDRDGVVPPLCDREQALAVKRVAVSDDPDDENPALEAITLGGISIPPDLDGVSIPACEAPCPRYRLAVDATDDSEQTIPGTGRRETTFVAFAIDSGTLAPAFDDDEPFETFWTPVPGAGEARIFVVLHDDRGGVDFREILVDTR